MDSILERGAFMVARRGSPRERQEQENGCSHGLRGSSLSMGAKENCENKVRQRRQKSTR